MDQIVETVDQLPQISLMNTPKKNNPNRNEEAIDSNTPLRTTDESEGKQSHIELNPYQFS